MKRALTATSLLTLLLTLSVFSQEVDPRSGSHIRENSVYVGADGKYEVAPDTAVVSLTATAQEKYSDDAYRKLSKATERIREVLRSNGIDPNQRNWDLHAATSLRLQVIPAEDRSI